MNEYEILPLNNNINVVVSTEHKFGTDAFILADFAKIKNNHRVCDFCTGCGIIPMLIEKKYSPREIVGIEIQKQGIDQFQKSISISKIQSKIMPILCDLKETDEVLERNYFDVVTCNPPYKINGTGVKNEYSPHIIARHEVLCNINDICEGAYKILKNSGKLYICQRPERLADTLQAMRTNKIEPKEIRFISKTSTSAPWLFVVEGRKNGGQYLKVLAPLIVYNDNIYTQEMEQIYK